MAAFPLRNSSTAQRCRLLLVSLAVAVAAGIALVARAQGLGAVDEQEIPAQIAATRTPGVSTQSAHVQPDRDRSASEPIAGERTPYDLASYWADADLVARGTLLCLGVMFLGGAYVLLRRSWDQQLVLRNAQTVNSRFWTAPNLYEAVRTLENRSAFRAIAEDGLEAATHKEGRLTDRIGANEWIAMSLQRSVGVVNDKLQHGLAFLETVGATAPFIGLFGTVWGIHRALTAGASEDLIAVPVGAALGMTAIGLAVAVLAMLGFRWLSGRNKTAIAAVRAFADTVQAMLLNADVLVESGQTHRRQKSGAVRGTP